MCICITHLMDIPGPKTSWLKAKYKEKEGGRCIALLVLVIQFSLLLSPLHLKNNVHERSIIIIIMCIYECFPLESLFLRGKGGEKSRRIEMRKPGDSILCI